MIYTIGIIITSFLSFILLTKKKTQADKILFLWLCIIAIHLALFALISSQTYIHFPHLLGLEIPIPLLHGPLLFLYTRSLTTPKITIGKNIFHFIPFITALLSVVPFLIKEAEAKVFVYRNEGAGYSTLMGIVFAGIFFSGIIYSFLSLYSLVEYKKKIKENYSYTEKINLQWLFNLIIGLSCIWVIVIFADDKVIFTSVVLYVLFIGYFGIKQVGLFTNLPVGHPTVPEPEPVAVTSARPENSDSARSLLNQPQLEQIHAELKQLMDAEKLFLTPELTLSMVAERLKVHPNTLSEVINRAEQKNFFDYVNSMRVEAFKENVAKPENQHYTLLSIAHDCGFNSKTSFNRNFKNITGQSPSEYLREIKIKLS